MSADAMIAELRAKADSGRTAGMARVGINVSHALGVSVPDIRAVAKRNGNDHDLAFELWSTGSMKPVSSRRSWPILDVSMKSRRSPGSAISPRGISATSRPTSSVGRRPRPGRSGLGRAAPEGYVKRCAFSMIARRAVWAKEAPDREFIGYLPVIRRGASDERNEVKKGVSWALRQIGKRNRALHSAAIDEAERILLLGTPSARWLARDALRELKSEKTRSRLPD